MQEHNEKPKRNWLKAVVWGAGGYAAGWAASFIAGFSATLSVLPKIMRQMSREKNMPAEFLMKDPKTARELNDRLIGELVHEYPMLMPAARIAPYAGAGAGAAWYLSHTRHAKKSEEKKPESWQEREHVREEARTEGQSCSTCRGGH